MWWSVFSVVGGVLSKMLPGGGLGSLADKLADAYIRKEEAKNNKERMKADIEISALESRRDVLIAESVHFWPVFIRSTVRLLWALPPAIYFAKLWVWDKVLGLGVTDDISDRMMWIATVVVGFYFLLEVSDSKK